MTHNDLDNQVTSSLFILFRLLQPLVLSKLLDIYDKNVYEESKNEAYQFSGLLLLLNVFNVLLIHQFNLRIMEVGMKIRVASCSLIYRKSLRLSKNALAETTIGQMVNLISNDVSRFDFGTMHMHHLVMGPLEMIVGMGLVYKYVGWTGLSGAIFLLISIPIQCK